MKNIISILLFSCSFISFTSCNEYDTFQQVEPNKTQFNPPSWIQGKWGYQKNDNSFEFRFTKDNFYVKNGTEMDYNNLINMTNAGGNNIIVTETTTDNMYKLSLKGGIITADFEFKKLNSQTIINISNDTYLEMYKK